MDAEPVFKSVEADFDDEPVEEVLESWLWGKGLFRVWLARREVASAELRIRPIFVIRPKPPKTLSSLHSKYQTKTPKRRFH